MQHCSNCPTCSMLECILRRFKSNAPSLRQYFWFQFWFYSSRYCTKSLPHRYFRSPIDCCRINKSPQEDLYIVVPKFQVQGNHITSTWDTFSETSLGYTNLSQQHSILAPAVRFVSHGQQPFSNRLGLLHNKQRNTIRSRDLYVARPPHGPRLSVRPITHG